MIFCCPDIEKCDESAFIKNRPPEYKKKAGELNLGKLETVDGSAYRYINVSALNHTNPFSADNCNPQTLQNLLVNFQVQGNIDLSVQVMCSCADIFEFISPDFFTIIAENGSVTLFNPSNDYTVGSFLPAVALMFTSNMATNTEIGTVESVDAYLCSSKLGAKSDIAFGISSIEAEIFQRFKLNGNDYLVLSCRESGDGHYILGGIGI